MGPLDQYTSQLTESLLFSSLKWHCVEYYRDSETNQNTGKEDSRTKGTGGESMLNSGDLIPTLEVRNVSGRGNSKRTVS